MKARITDQCMGDRNCNKLCPEVFQYDEDQMLSMVQLGCHQRVRKTA